MGSLSKVRVPSCLLFLCQRHRSTEMKAMPVQCPIEFRPVETQVMRELDYRVMGHAYQIQNELGRMCDEIVYKHALAARLAEDAMPAITEMPMNLSFRAFSKTLYVDLVVATSVLYELKVARSLTSQHENQLLTYLMLVGANRGKLINFRPVQVESRFVNQMTSREERVNFKTEEIGGLVCPKFRDLVVALLRDWGTGLSQNLYFDAITANLGGEEQVVQAMPMEFDGRSVGRQKFSLLDSTTAFHITTYKKSERDVQFKHLRKMILASQLNRMQWVNIARGEVSFQTITR